MKLLILLFGGLMSASVLAMELGDAKAPTQTQLNLLLSGNTVQGEWDGRLFTQYFAATGSTHYREGDGAQSLGTWRVNVKGQYCSV